MERQIGEQFDFLGVKLEVIEGEENPYDDCEGCYFFDTPICGCEIITNYIGYCSHSVREDGKDVIFKKVE